MAVTDYYTVDGRIIGEATTGTRTDYLADALGSVTATVDSSANVVNTYRYKPYGARLSKSGAGADPKFQWVGAYGYRNTGLAASDLYVRARHYGSAQGAWTTTDALWPDEPSYIYVSDSPSTRIDFSGNQEDPPPPQEWVRVRSKETPVTGVTAHIELPECCKRPRPTEYYFFWLAFGISPNERRGTAIDCGVSFSCNAPARGGGWKVTANAGFGNDASTKCDACQAGGKVALRLLIQNGRAQCIACWDGKCNSVTLPDPVAHRNTWVAQHTIGLEFQPTDPKDLLAHSTATYSNLQIQRREGGSWKKWEASDKTKPQYDKRKGDYTVVTEFPLSAYLRGSSRHCDCSLT